MRVVIRVPKVAIERLSQNSSTTVNSQISNILETFFWGSLPFICDFEVRGIQCTKMTIQLSAQANSAMRNYCIRNRKSQTMALAQALERLGVFQLQDLE